MINTKMAKYGGIELSLWFP